MKRVLGKPKLLLKATPVKNKLHKTLWSPCHWPLSHLVLLAMVQPPTSPVEFLRGIAEGFLQIQPESVSAALLKKDNLDG